MMNCLSYNRDLKNSLDTAREEGKEEGRAEGQIEKQFEIAKNLKALGLSFDLIKQSTGLTDDELFKL